MSALGSNDMVAQPQLQPQQQQEQEQEQPQPWTCTSAVQIIDFQVIRLVRPDGNYQKVFRVQADSKDRAFSCHEIYCPIGKPELECRASFCSKQLLDQHQKSLHQRQPFTCGGCGEAFSDSANWTRHCRSCKALAGVKTIYKCKLCGKTGPRRDNFKRHAASRHPDVPKADREPLVLTAAEQRANNRAAIDAFNAGIQQPLDANPPQGQQSGVSTAEGSRRSPSPAPATGPTMPPYNNLEELAATSGVGEDFDANNYFRFEQQALEAEPQRAPFRLMNFPYDEQDDVAMTGASTNLSPGPTFTPNNDMGSAPVRQSGGFVNMNQLELHGHQAGMEIAPAYLGWLQAPAALELTANFNIGYVGNPAPAANNPADFLWEPDLGSP